MYQISQSKMSNLKNKIEFGDFQTPPELASRICHLLRRNGVKPASLIEPTCGIGNFVFSALNCFSSIKKGFALDIDSSYTKIVNENVGQNKGKMEIQTGDFFQFNWDRYIAGLPEPILIIGNPPWVTNAQIGSINGSNLPPKSNLHKLKGFDALTGKSNFDISEWILIRLAEVLTGRHGIIAMLCKLSVARKTLAYAWKKGLEMTEAALYEIDAKEDFGASVGACLLVGKFIPKARSKECRWHTSLSPALSLDRTIGLRDGRIVSDIDLYEQWKHLIATTEQKYRWRSGIKHDCSKVMELHLLGGNRYRNGLGEEIELEDDYLYPLIKSSELFNEKEPSRWLIVTQKRVGNDTGIIKDKAPKTWAYLTSHRKYFDSRTSSIYRNKPSFSIFGVGDYSFSPWKVAVSGLYKEPRFRLLSEHMTKPIIPDDTVNFVSIKDKDEAEKLVGALNSTQVKNFFKTVTFLDAKRPFTIELLSRLDIEKLMGREQTRTLFPLLTD